MKTVLITGGARGIGRATAIRLLANGYSVAFTFSTSGDAAAELMATAPDRLLAIPGDIRDDTRNRAVVDEVVSRFGSIDGLVNNAGIRRDSLMYNMSAEQWAEVVETYLHGAFSMTRAVLVPMMKQRRGAIVNVASISGMHGVVGQTNYSAAKGGLIAMTKSLAREVARSGIRVNCVAPGPVWTPLNVADKPAAEAAEHGKGTPMERPAQPEEVAPAFVFFASEADSSYITGEVLTLLGGETAAA